MNRRMRSAVVAAALLAAGCSQHGSTETIGIGHVAPMTGSEKSVGDRARQGIRTAVDAANAKSDDLVLGRKLAVRHADAKSDGHDAEAEAVRLVSVNKVVALLGGTDSPMAEQLARGAESAGVPVILQAALPSASPNENAYSCAPSLSRRGYVLGKFAAAEKKWGKIAVVLDEGSSAAGPVAEAFLRELPKDAAQRFTFKKADDFPALSGSITAAKPQAVLFLGSARDLGRFRSEMQKTLAGTALLFGGEESSLSALLGDRATGADLYLATSYLATDETPANQTFVNQFQERFHEPPDGNAALAYDGTRLWCEALRKANGTNPAKLREALAQLKDFESVTGPLTFGPDRHARRPLFVVQIKNGQPTLQKRYGPDD